MFLDLKSLEGEEVAFGSTSKGKIIGIGKVHILSIASIDNVLYIEGLKYNLLRISQFYDSGYIMSFNKHKCTVKTKDIKSFFVVRRYNNMNKIDVIDLSKQNVTCMLSTYEIWIWHKIKKKQLLSECYFTNHNNLNLIQIIKCVYYLTELL